ncbi:isocitrate dehydrogenase [Thermogymnomonas acidicola]|uniref:Isocitrate dehydrogenase (NADP(+)) n=1 Tax=Thermogymnomonas acidicola TaxID=399579 RepID=A0AA37BQH9_9ARCH|nr:isocitrate dehydrogenase (NADP(+)) [Thermogymnomonas acidicola]GGM69783.1 isocitrate dehydrogenase [Thermogymnomonas acidicola]
MTYIEIKEGTRLSVPNNPTIGYIEGDGIGPDITKATLYAINSSLEFAYKGERSIEWQKVMVGDEAYEKTGKRLPQESLEQLRRCVVSIKGPLTTPVGEGFRSLNVTLRQYFDLYANIRPVRYFPGVPSPVKNPEKVNMVVFRENTEDLYAGIEWKYDSEEANRVRQFLSEQFNISLTPDTGIGIKPISKFRSQRLVRKAIQYAIANKRRSVTLVHKGNIMKYTEGAFKDWGYELAATEFRDQTVTEEEYSKNPEAYRNRIVVKDRITDNMFQQVLTRTEEYDVIATTNLNGDYLSDAIAAQVGGLGIAPGGNVGDVYAIFEAVHGTAPKYAGLDVANPTSLMLSGVMMLQYIGWNEAAKVLEDAIVQAYKDQKVTQDLARVLNIKPLKCSEFAEEVVKRMKPVE